MVPNVRSLGNNQQLILNPKNWFSELEFLKLSEYMCQIRVSSMESVIFSNRFDLYLCSLVKDCPIIEHKALHLVL